MKVSIFGAGYVGLVTGVCLAKLGHQVCCCDIDSDKIALLKQGRAPFYEQGLEKLLVEQINAKRIIFTTATQNAVDYGQVLIVAVGTPPKADGSVDLSYVQTVAKTIGQHIQSDALIVTKSTVPVGTANQVREIIAEKLIQRNKNITFDVASNPEFLREGCAINDFMKPDRIVVGVDSDKAEELLKALYLPLIDQGRKFISMDIRSAEMSKYAANAFLATKISFINEMSQIADRLGANISEIKKVMALDSRINEKFLNPGCGFGGSCFPKDVSALTQTAAEVNYQAQLLKAVVDTNHKQKTWLFDKVKHYFDYQLQNKTIAFWGLAFKPGTDDIREAPSCVLMKLFLKEGVTIQAYDPLAMDNVKRAFVNDERLTLCDNPYAALSEADALIVVTEWDEFANPDFSIIKQALKSPVIFDGRNIYNPNEVVRHGIDYIGMGNSGVSQG